MIIAINAWQGSRNYTDYLIMLYVTPLATTTKSGAVQRASNQDKFSYVLSPHVSLPARALPGTTSLTGTDQWWNDSRPLTPKLPLMTLCSPWGQASPASCFATRLHTRPRDQRQWSGRNKKQQRSSGSPRRRGGKPKTSRTPPSKHP